MFSTEYTLLPSCLIKDVCHRVDTPDVPWCGFQAALAGLLCQVELGVLLIAEAELAHHISMK